MPSHAAFRRAAGFIRRRTRVGILRVRSSLLKIVHITVGAVAAYWFAEEVLGHEEPLFAATSAMIASGFGRDTTLRRTLEVALGCTLGIAVGDLLLSLLGTGIWQAAVVVALSLALARFLDSGTIFSTQLGLQSLLVVLLPVPEAGPFARSLDAIVGGLFAVAITILIPRHPRSEPVKELRGLLGELSGVLRECAAALLSADSTSAWHALVRARTTQELMNALPAALKSAQETAMISPAFRRYRGELERLRRVADGTDLAVRNSRVFTRRLAHAITHGIPGPEAAEALAEFLEGVADAVDLLGHSVAEEHQSARDRAEHAARNELAACASRLAPGAFGVSGLEGEGLVLLLRPLLVDLQEAAGTSHEDAVRYLPRL
ncbi:hypothetical protein NCCP1664_25760 [Zafaria cholistanensis]|uniref:Integral membrane bound transporter domain-containing protein n=1 Tax=Zafaria cholistanensis TaxID=1682741 RepID=A0A5A7NVG4_9MICC|nr:FUSC family protein [Zafaria cholistanensis]GER24081.1 hypothetical protein NCCP1664_25760 [Zafaria cholistanensis]